MAMETYAMRMPISPSICSSEKSPGIIMPFRLGTQESLRQLPLSRWSQLKAGQLLGDWGSGPGAATVIDRSLIMRSPWGGETSAERRDRRGGTRGLLGGVMQVTMVQ